MVDDTGGRPALVAGALTTLRNPAMMAVVLGLAVVFGLCFAAGQAPPVVIIGSAVLMALALFAAASSGARGSVALDRYARSRGLKFVGGKFPRFLLMPSRPQRLGAYPVRFTTGLIGPIGGGPSGVIAVLFPNVAHYRYNTPSSCLPIACYDFSTVGDKLGTDSFSVWTVDGRLESDRASDHTATPLLDPELAAWLVRSGGVSFEFVGGWLFVTDASCPPRPSSTGLDHLAQAAAHVAARVLEAVSTSAAAADAGRPALSVLGPATAGRPTVVAPPTVRPGSVPVITAASALILLAFGAFILVALVASGRIGGSPSPVVTPVPRIGVPVVAGDQTVVVETVEQWPGDTDFPAAPGDVYVTVELAITPGNDGFIDTLDTRVRAGDGSSYVAEILGTREPFLPAGALTSGVTVMGWMTFEVPADLAGRLTLIYATSFGNLSTPPVSVLLY